MKHYIIVSSFGTIFICLLHTYIEFTLHSQSQLGVKAGKVEVQDWKRFCSGCESRGSTANVSGYDWGGDLFYIKVALSFSFFEKSSLSLPSVL